MNVRRWNVLGIMLVAALLVFASACGSADESRKPESATPTESTTEESTTTPVPTTTTESVTTTPDRDPLVPKPIQIGPKDGGGSLEYKEDGSTISPTGGSSIRGDLVGSFDIFEGKHPNVITPSDPLVEVRITFEDGQTAGGVQQYSDVTIRNDGSDLVWEKNGVAMTTCDPCDDTCNEELVPAVMLNKVSGPILVKIGANNNWVAVEHINIKMNQERCPS